MAKFGCLFVFTTALFAAAAAGADPAEKPWKDLLGDNGLSEWKAKGAWEVVGEVTVNPDNPRRLASKPGKGVIWNGPGGRAPDLVSNEKFQDVELHAEFFIPKKSNSGVKFQTHYEIQIDDCYGIEKPTADHCGGIYPRAELLPKYRYLDKGTPPLVNAAKPAGEWQTLDAIFLSPRFDADGKKTANARFVKVLLNGTLIHEGVDQATPTGHAWTKKETADGPLLLQGDHGPVAFRNIRVRPYAAAGEKDKK
jgi:hypothetical protein